MRRPRLQGRWWQMGQGASPLLVSQRLVGELLMAQGGWSPSLAGASGSGVGGSAQRSWLWRRPRGWPWVFSPGRPPAALLQPPALRALPGLWGSWMRSLDGLILCPGLPIVHPFPSHRCPGSGLVRGREEGWLAWVPTALGPCSCLCARLRGPRRAGQCLDTR